MMKVAVVGLSAMGLEDEDNAALIKAYSRLNDIKLPDIKKSDV